MHVGSYAFTTLQPQLGVVTSEDMRLLVADIPGLIPGASKNRGLGHAFLKHVERTGVLAFVLDVSTVLLDKDGLHPCEQLKMLQVQAPVGSIPATAASIVHETCATTLTTDVLQDELGMHSFDLLRKPAVVIANKMDLLKCAGNEVVQAVRCTTELPVFTISAKTGAGVDAVRQALLHMSRKQGVNN